MSQTVLFLLLIFMLILSAFFSASETGLMSMNRYRLRHQARTKKTAALRVQKLLERPDKILVVILIGNTCANIFAASLTTLIALRYFGDVGVAVCTIILTLVLLIFGEITPKTLAAMYPEKVAFPASGILSFLLIIMFPIVWAGNMISSVILKMFNIKVKKKGLESLSHEELRTVVHEAVGNKSSEYQEMLLGILDLNRVVVEDIMVPLNEIVGINLEDDWSRILVQLQESEHTRMPVYRGAIDNIVGILHVRKVLKMFVQDREDKQSLAAVTDPAYMIPEATPLNTLLINFRDEKCRIGLVVDEYGEILGLATLEDILEEIVGEFTTGMTDIIEDVKLQKDGSYVIDGAVNIRDLNRVMQWELPITGPKTLSGLIIEHLEMIPKSRVCVKISGYPMEVCTVKGNIIVSVQVWPDRRQKPITDEPAH